MKSVYVLGDSISIDYHDSFAASLPLINVLRKDGMDEAKLNLDNPNGANVGTSSMALRFLKALAMQAEPKQADLFLLNCGLHDIKVDKATNQIEVSQTDFQKNLQAIAGLMPSLADNWAWIRITPVDDEQHAARQTNFTRYQKDVDSYNAIADRIMSRNNVPCIDLATFTLAQANVISNHWPESIFRDGVHFRGPMKSLQGAFLAGWVENYFKDKCL